MPNRNPQRARPCYTPARGKVQTNITPYDHRRLLRELAADPRRVLGLFPSCNLGYVGELQGWDKLHKQQPDVAQRILDVAAQMGISEKPTKEKHPCPTPKSCA